MYGGRLSTVRPAKHAFDALYEQLYTAAPATMGMDGCPWSVSPISRLLVGLAKSVWHSPSPPLDGEDLGCKMARLSGTSQSIKDQKATFEGESKSGTLDGNRDELSDWASGWLRSDFAFTLRTQVLRIQPVEVRDCAT